MQKDSVFGTLLVAALLCIFCSVLVSGAAVGLKERQETNRTLDIKKNLLLASGLLKDKKPTKENIERIFSTINSAVVDLSTGKVREDIDPESFDQQKMRSNQDTNRQIPSSEDLADIKVRSQLAKVYKYVENDEVQMYIFPVYGKGLWSTMYGFLALAPDLNTIRGIGFYQHGETPGLGGEIENPRWQSQWKGKKLYDKGEFTDVEFHVIKGQVNEGSKGSEHEVDGLSGATITSKGVTGLVRYWMGPDAFGPYIKNQLGGTSSNTQDKKEKNAKEKIKSDKDSQQGAA